MKLDASKRIYRISASKLKDLTKQMQIVVPGLQRDPVDIIYLALQNTPGNVYTAGGISFGPGDIVAQALVGRHYLQKGYRFYQLDALDFYLFPERKFSNFISL